MGVKVVLFDLDGTLLPMDQDSFIEAYFQSLASNLQMHGYAPKKLKYAIFSGTDAMINNDGSKTNEEAFWDCAAEILGEQSRSDLALFENFYETEFDTVSEVCLKNERIPKIIDEISALGFRIALATNPVFPRVATKKRISWAGLSPDDFELYTSYENCSYCKPNLKYYEEICKKLGAAPEDCIMVGNDTADDLVAEKLGMKVFLIKDHLINKNETDISLYPNGGFDNLLDYLKNI